MKTEARFVDRERFVLQPVLQIGEELGNSLDDLSGVASNVSVRLPIRPGPFPDVIEHPVMLIQCKHVAGPEISPESTLSVNAQPRTRQFIGSTARNQHILVRRRMACSSSSRSSCCRAPRRKTKRRIVAVNVKLSLFLGEAKCVSRSAGSVCAEKPKSRRSSGYLREPLGLAWLERRNERAQWRGNHLAERSANVFRCPLIHVSPPR
jgi:hypothetical protein